MDSFRSRFHLSALFEFQPRSLDGNIYRGSLPRPLVALLLLARQHDDREKQPARSSSYYLSVRRASIGTCPSFFSLSLSRCIISLPLSSSLIHFMEFVRLGLFALLITFRSYLSPFFSLPPCLTPRSIRNFTNRMDDRQFRTSLCRFYSNAIACGGICQMEFKILLRMKLAIWKWQSYSF